MSGFVPNQGGGVSAHGDLSGLTSGDDHTQYQKESEKGSANGYAGLDANTRVTANGLIFPATQVASADANTLDDYEEGTFTPQLADASLDGSGEGQVYDVQIGRYTKVGRQVNFSLAIRCTDLGTLTTSEGANVVGLPFVAATITNFAAPVFCGFASSLNITAGQVVTGIVNGNTSYVQLNLWDSAGGISDLLLSEFSASGLIYLFGAYEV